MSGKKKKNERKSEVKLTPKMHPPKPKFGTELGGNPKKNMTKLTMPLFRRSTIPSKQNNSPN